MLLTSPSFNPNEKIPSKFTCDGGNINPELHIQNVPSDAKSLALILDDPDAVGGKTFTHWLVWNIDPKTEIIKQESVPPGSKEGLNDSNDLGYAGPCPPVGNPRRQRAEQSSYDGNRAQAEQSSYDGKPHRYFFKLYALKDIIPLEEGALKVQLEKAIEPLLIEKCELIGIYER